MKIEEIASLINGKVVCGEEHNNLDITIAFASDLMSDVLTVKVDNVLLITGLTNVQTIRTAEMSDIRCILFTRDKIVTDDMIKLACENDMVLLTTPYSTFRTAGILFQNGINPVY